VNVGRFICVYLCFCLGIIEFVELKDHTSKFKPAQRLIETEYLYQPCRIYA